MRPTKNVDKKLLNIYYLAAPSSGSDSNAGSPEGCNDAIQAGDRSLELGSRSEANSVSPLPQKSGSLLSMTSQVFFWCPLDGAYADIFARLFRRCKVHSTGPKSKWNVCHKLNYLLMMSLLLTLFTPMLNLIDQDANNVPYLILLSSLCEGWYTSVVPMLNLNLYELTADVLSSLVK